MRESLISASLPNVTMLNLLLQFSTMNLAPLIGVTRTDVHKPVLTHPGHILGTQKMTVKCIKEQMATLPEGTSNTSCHSCLVTNSLPHTMTSSDDHHLESRNICALQAPGTEANRSAFLWRAPRNIHFFQHLEVLT